MGRVGRARVFGVTLVDLWDDEVHFTPTACYWSNILTHGPKKGPKPIQFGSFSSHPFAALREHIERGASLMRSRGRDWSQPEPRGFFVKL